MGCYLACRLDHFFDGKTDTISKVENIAFAAVTQIMQGEDVGLGKIVDMDVVTDTGAGLCRASSGTGKCPNIGTV